MIAHSSRVRTPKRHNSESVLYMNDDQTIITSDCKKQASQNEQQTSRNNCRLFPISTYTETNGSESPQKLNNQQLSIK